MNFYNWAINNGYTEELTIDRIDVNGNYCPENCRWATKVEQANNRRSNILIEYNGEVKNLKTWCNELNLDYDLIRARHQRGNYETIEELFFAEKKKTTPYVKYNGETHSWKEWSDITGIKLKTLYSRYHLGYSLDDIFYNGNIQKRDKLYGKGENKS
jgi:TusA-related sulfurtransferase